MTKFSVTSDELHKAAAWAARLTPSKTVVPVLAGMVVDAADDRLELSCFDYERAGIVRLDALVQGPGRLLLPARMFADVAGAAGRGDNLTVDGSGSQVVVTAGRAKWTLPKLDITEYPLLPKLGDPIGTVEAQALRTALDRALLAVGKDATLPMLTGVRIEATPDTLTLTCTDRFRLATADVPWEASGGGFDALIPATLLEVAVKAEADNGSFELGLGANDGLFSLDGGAYKLIGRQLDAQFPRWQSLIPTGNTCRVTIPTADLLLAVKQAEPAMDRTPHLTLQIDSAAGTAALSVTGDDRSATAEMAADATSDTCINFDARYFKAAVEGAASDKTRFEFHPENPRKPFLVLGDDPDRYKHLVMPVK